MGPKSEIPRPTLCPCPFREVMLRGRPPVVQVHRSVACAGYELDPLYYGEAFVEAPK